jgi:hypothetical protein
LTSFTFESFTIVLFRLQGVKMFANITITHRAIEILSLWIVVAVLTAGCGRDLNSAQGVAEEFVDQRFVQFDLGKAKLYAVSVALEKVNEELRLTSGHKIDAATNKPRINYKLLEKRESPRRATFLYEGTINADDGTSFTRRWLITARKDGDHWRVSNFTESE